jgi:nucleotide-binding universal stress UspA family protein
MPAITESIVVGVNDSPGSQAAVRWACEEARTRTAEVRLVCAYRWALPYRWDGMYAGVTDPELTQLRHAAETLVDKTIEGTARVAPGVELTGQAIEGTAAHVLITESQHASMLVVGSRHLKALGSVLLGSVGAGVAARASCPVVVVRGPAGLTAERAAVVVGIDPTDSVEPALEFGFDHASRHHVPLHAVMCWAPDLLASMQWRAGAAVPDSAEVWLSESLAGWREKYPDVEVSSSVQRDKPVPGLVAASNAQHLLVVRSRTRFALAGTLLGSVSQGVLRHATCPVAVIPAEDIEKEVRHG